MLSNKCIVLKQPSQRINSPQAQATGADKRRLAALCERLVVLREGLDTQRMEDYYASTLRRLAAAESSAAGENGAPNALMASQAAPAQQQQLSAGAGADGPGAAAGAALADGMTAAGAAASGAAAAGGALAAREARQAAAALALTSDPRRYAAALAESVTGVPIVKQVRCACGLTVTGSKVPSCTRFLRFEVLNDAGCQARLRRVHVFGVEDPCCAAPCIAGSSTAGCHYDWYPLEVTDDKC